MTTREIGYWPIISLGYLEPIGLLFERLADEPKSRPSPVQVGSIENAISASIVVLTITMLESVIRRIQACDRKTNQRNAGEYLKSRFPEMIQPQHVDELFTIRDTLVHNHIWYAKVYWNRIGALRFRHAKRDPNFGDKKFLDVLNKKTKKTTTLKLNLFPTCVCRIDAVKVFSEVVSLLHEIENVDRRYVYITNEHLTFRGEDIFAIDLPKVVRKAVAAIR
jgi:hypothetical protein